MFWRVLYPSSSDNNWVDSDFFLPTRVIVHVSIICSLFADSLYLTAVFLYKNQFLIMEISYSAPIPHIYCAVWSNCFELPSQS